HPGELGQERGKLRLLRSPGEENGDEEKAFLGGPGEEAAHLQVLPRTDSAPAQEHRRRPATLDPRLGLFLPETAGSNLEVDPGLQAPALQGLMDFPDRLAVPAVVAQEDVMDGRHSRTTVYQGRSPLPFPPPH